MESRWVIEAKRWLRDALEDLRVAELLFQHSHYAHTCFHSHQALEKFLKAMLYAKGIELRGHSITKLLQKVVQVYGIQLEDKFWDYAKEMEKHYAEPRYPNLHPGTDLSAYELYTRFEAERCLKIVKELIEFLKRYVTF